MKNPSSTNPELTEEISFLKQRIKELEQLESDRKRIEDELQESNKRYKSLIESANEGIFVAQDNMLRFVNPAFTKIIGYSELELTAKQFIYFIHPEDRDMVSEKHIRRMRGEKFPSKYEFRVVTREGTTKDVELDSVMIQWGGKPAALVFINDITSRKQLEDRLKKNEQRFRSLSEASLEAIVFIENGIIVDANEALNSLFGYEGEDLRGRPATDFVVPEKRSFTNERISNQTADIYETLGFRKDGSTFPIEVNPREFEHEGKKLRISAVRDLTEWKKAEKALLESEQRYKAVFENTGAATVIIEADTIISLCNAEFERLSGYTRNEIEGKKGWTEFVVREDMERMVTQHRMRRENHDHALQGYEFRFVPRTGKIRSIYLVIDTIHGTEKSVASLIDITSRKHAEKALQESELKFRTLFEDSRDAIYITTTEGRFHNFNRAYLELFGYTKEEMVALHVKDTYMNAADREVFKKMMEKNGSVRDYETKLRKKDGHEMNCLITAAVRYADNGSILEYQGIIKDITEQKKMEEKLHAMSLTDDLTGLYNRRGFFTLAQQQMKVAERTKKNMLLFFADLDKMKHINDTLGHQEGDNALIEIATILREAFRESDIMGRMGGDEFACLAIDTSDETREVLIKRLHNTLDNYNRPEKNYQLSLSIGIAHYNPETPSTLDELMAEADTLMYEEKRNKQH